MTYRICSNFCMLLSRLRRENYVIDEVTIHQTQTTQCCSITYLSFFACRESILVLINPGTLVRWNDRYDNPKSRWNINWRDVQRKNVVQKQCRHIKFKVTMTKWHAQKQTQNSTKHAEHQYATDIQNNLFCALQIFFCYSIFIIS